MPPLKKLLPSLILIAIYLIADEFFGPQTGAICAIILGGAEFIYNRIKEKTNDWLILITTLFFCIPGALTLITDNPALSQLQSGIVELTMCGLLSIFAFSKANITSGLPASYRKDLRISPLQQKVMKKIIRLLLYILCLHCCIVFLSFFYSSASAFSFISGPLLYILLAAFFAALFIRNWLLARRYRKEEWLPIVNEEGEISGKAPRRICHSGSKLLHPVVHLHITNPQKELFLQKRSMKKDLLPGMWDTAVGGHVGLNEKIEDALRRETFEELGITEFKARFIRSYVWESVREKELVFSFICSQYNRINIDNDEVDEGKFWNKKEIEDNLSNNVFTPNFIHEYNTVLKNIL